MIKLIQWLFPSTYSEIYHKGKWDGWVSCEKLVTKRIEREYPDEYEKMIYNIVL